MARDELAQVVLRQQVDGEAVFEHRDVRMAPHRFDERPFDLGAREVLVVEDAVFGMPAFAVELEAAVGRAVEARAPGDQVADRIGRLAHDAFHGLGIALARAAHERVADVLLECVGRIGHRADAALGIVGVALIHLALGDDGDATALGGFQCEAQAGGAGADNQEIGFHTKKMHRCASAKVRNNSETAIRPPIYSYFCRR